jgi:hypothetical protein
MPKRTSKIDHDPDPNSSVARVIEETFGKPYEPPADVLRAWEAWSARIQRVDERTRELLRAAFLSGASAAGQTSTARDLGRRGGLKGGKARAAKLSKARRRQIAQDAARARWKPGTSGNA